MKKTLSLILSLILMTSTAWTHEKIKTVIFDFGGVVATLDKPKIVQFIKDSFQLSPDEFNAVLTAWKEVLAKSSNDRAFWIDFAVTKNLQIPEPWFEELHKLKSFVEISGTMEIVKALQCQGYQTVMLSNVEDYQANAVKAFGYNHYFNPVFLSYEMGVAKPHPDAYRIVLERLELKPEQVFFVDDNPENVEAAKKLGIEAALFTTPWALKAALLEKGILIERQPDHL